MHDVIEQIMFYWPWVLESFGNTQVIDCYSMRTDVAMTRNYVCAARSGFCTVGRGTWTEAHMASSCEEQPSSVVSAPSLDTPPLSYRGHHYTLYHDFEILVYIVNVCDVFGHSILLSGWWHTSLWYYKHRKHFNYHCSTTNDVPYVLLYCLCVCVYIYIIYFQCRTIT